MKTKSILLYSLLGFSLFMTSCGNGDDLSSENTNSSEDIVSSNNSISEDNSSINSSEFNVIEFEGNGTESEPYKIYNENGLDEFARLFNEGEIDDYSYVELADDINYNNKEWTPLGTLEKPFTCKFDGKGYSIKNIKISEFNDEFGDYSLYGFFGFTNKASIKNVNFDSFNLSLDVYGKDHIVYVGGLAAYANNTYIYNVHMNFETYSIKSLQNGNSGIYAGGISGFLSSTSDEEGMYYVDLTNSSVTGDINLNMRNSASTISYAAGLSAVVYTGYLDGIYAINNCYFNGNVTSGTFAGGLVASLSSLTSIVDSYAYGESITTTDTAGAYVGGIVASATYETAIMNCYSGYDTLVAPNSSDFYKSYAGEIAGVFVEDDYEEGSSYLGTAIYNCYALDASTLTADNVYEFDHVTIDSNFFKDTLNYSDKVWDFKETYPSLLDNYETYKVNVTLDHNYDDGLEDETYEADANNYNATLAVTITEASLSRENYSFNGYYYDEECTVAYRFYTPFNSDFTLYAKWTDLSQLIGTYTYVCDYYGEIKSTGTWKFDENYFYWISLDNAVMQYEYSFDGKNIFIGESIVGPMGVFVGGYEGEIFTLNDDGTITAYDVNDYSAVYTATKSSNDYEIPNYEGKAYLGVWYSADVELNLYSDGNCKARSYKSSQVYYYGGFIDNDGVLSISAFGKVSGDFKYDSTNDILYSSSKIFAREEIIEQYTSTTNNVLVAVCESKTYAVVNGVVSNNIEGEFAEGNSVKINGITYKVSGDNLLTDEEIPTPEEPKEEEKTSTYLGTWVGKVGVADVTIVINEDGTLSYNSLVLNYEVNGNVISAPDLTITYNENNQSIYVEYYWDGYEALIGTITNYTPFSEVVDQNKYVGTYKNQNGATLVLDDEGNGIITINGGADRTFKYSVTSDGITISDWYDSSGEYEVESVTVNSNGSIAFEMCYDSSSYHTWTFVKQA